MLFNSFKYLLFFPIVILVYYLIPSKYRWGFLLFASYFFYMNWEPIYAILIFLSTGITFVCASQIDKKHSSPKYRRLMVVTSILLNFGILFVFKYYNFITSSVYDVLTSLGLRVHFPEFKLMLPVGISFYTFQAVGYSIDVYKRKLQHEQHFGRYALFVSFFPQLVAGPIERAKNLLPQFSEHKKFEYHQAIVGTKLIIWGYFMKVVVADRLSLYVDSVYNNVTMHSSLSLIVATVLFAFQIYCDFAGYSNIAIGSAKIMGFDLMTNFRRPYFAKSVPEFWQRWHISLSTWFRDYVYIPLGGNRVSKSRNYFNLFVTFLVSGLWHGANWTFIIWGGLNGIYQIFSSAFKKVKVKFKLKFLKVLITFILINISWVFFRANSIHEAFYIISKILKPTGELFTGGTKTILLSMVGLSILLIKETYDEFNVSKKLKPSRPLKMLWYIFLVVLILLIGVFDGGQFIYFQF